MPQMININCALWSESRHIIKHLFHLRSLLGERGWGVEEGRQVERKLEQSEHHITLNIICKCVKRVVRGMETTTRKKLHRKLCMMKVIKSATAEIFTTLERVRKDFNVTTCLFIIACSMLRILLIVIFFLVSLQVWFQVGFSFKLYRFAGSPNQTSRPFRPCIIKASLQINWRNIFLFPEQTSQVEEEEEDFECFQNAR